MKYKVELLIEVEKEFAGLNKSQQVKVAKQLIKLETNPFAGNPLGRKYNINLTGYFKLYADRKKIRIVYTVIKEIILIKVISIGKRESLAAYKKAALRILKGE